MSSEGGLATKQPTTQLPSAGPVGPFGVLIFLASDLMLFAGFFSAYYLLRGQAEVWPPAGTSLDVTTTAAATLILIASSFSLQNGIRAVQKGHPAKAQPWLALTVLLGGLFLANQVRDYMTIDFSPSSSAYGSVYWVLTGLHGLHVSAGLVAIILLSARLAKRPDDPGAAPEATAYYWHMVDIVWIAVFITIWIVR